MKNVSVPEAGIALSDVARFYGQSPAYIRRRFRDSGGYTEAEKDPTLIVNEGGGPRPCRYRLSVIQRVFPEFEPGQLLAGDLPREVADIIGRLKHKLPPDVAAVLPSRDEDPRSFENLAQCLIKDGSNLRIRAVAGTFFSYAEGHNAIYNAFEKRSTRIKRTPPNATPPSHPKILLLHPFSSTARLRSNAEESESQPITPVREDLTPKAFKQFRSTSMWRDFEQAWKFVRNDADALSLDVKWVRVAPHSFLIYTDECAVVETYDLGRGEADQARRERTCIGRKAPLIVVRPGSRYHQILRAGFDWSFDPSPRAGVKTYRVDDVAPTVLSRKVDQPLRAVRRSRADSKKRP